MSPLLLGAILVAMIGAVAIFATIVRSPVRGAYLYVFGSAITLSPELPIVREKLAACDFVMLMVWMSLVLRSDVWSRGFAKIDHAQRRALLAGAAYIVVCATSFCWNLISGGIDPLWVTRGGVEVFTYFYGFMAAVAIVALVDSWEKWINCVVAWALGVSVVSAVSVMAATVYAPPWAKDEFSGRISGTFREAAQVASYIGPIFPCMVFVVSAAMTSPRVRWILYATIPASLVAMLATGARTALVVLVLALAGLFAIRTIFVGRCRLNNLAFLMIAAGGLAGLGKFALDVVSDRSEKYQLGKTSPFERAIRMFSEWGEGERGLDDTRAHQVEAFSRYFWEHPVFGAGPANYGPRHRVHEMHNSYLASLADTGVLGFLTLMFWITTTWLAARRGLRRVRTPHHRLIVTAFLFGFCLLLLYQLTLLGLRQRPWWFMAGLMIALSRVADSTRATDDRIQTYEELQPRHLSAFEPV